MLLSSVAHGAGGRARRAEAAVVLALLQRATPWTAALCSAVVVMVLFAASALQPSSSQRGGHSRRKPARGWADESPNESLLLFDFARTPLTRPPNAPPPPQPVRCLATEASLCLLPIYTAQAARRQAPLPVRRAPSTSPPTSSARCLAGCEAPRLRNNVSIANRAAEHPYAIAFSARASTLRHAPVKPCCHALRPHAIIYVVALCTSDADSTA